MKNNGGQKIQVPVHKQNDFTYIDEFLQVTFVGWFEAHYMALFVCSVRGN